MDCFDGPEVMQTVHLIIQNALLQKMKSNQKKIAKEMIRKTFHVTVNKNPVDTRPGMADGKAYTHGISRKEPSL